MRRFVQTGAVLVVLLAATAGGSYAQPQPPIHIAFIAPLTGTVATLGHQDVNGFQLAVDTLNARGGVKGRRIEVNIQDSTLNPAQAIALIRRAASDPNTIGIVGPMTTPEIVAGSAVCAEAHIVCMSIGSATIWRGEFNPWTFRDQLIDVKVLAQVFATLKTKFPVRTVAMMYDVSNPCNVEEARLLPGIAEQDKFTVTAQESFRLHDRDFSGVLTKIIATKPDVLLISGTSDDAAPIIQQARDRGFTGRFLGGCADLADPTVFSRSGGAAKGAVTVFPFSAAEPRAMVRNFVSAYQARYHEDPPSYAALGYDAVILFASAIQREGAYTRDAFRDALGSTTAVMGVCGSYSYKGSGDNLTPAFHLYEFGDDGKYVLLR